MRNFVVIGLLIKIPLAFLTSWSDTVRYWEMMNTFLGNPRVVFSIYPPPWYLTMNLFIWPLSMLYDPSNFAVRDQALVEPWITLNISQGFITSPVFNLAVKAPLLIFDLLVGIVLYHIIKEKVDTSLAKKTFAFWYFNPLVILNVSVMGQTDVTLILFMLIAFYFLLKEGYLFSGIALGLSIFYKVYNAYVMPLFLLMIAFELGRESKNRFEHLKIKGARNAVKFLAGFSIPYVVLAPSIMKFRFLLEEWATIPQLTGFNIWGVIELIPQAHGIAYWANFSFFTLNTLMFLTRGLVAAVIIMYTIFLMKGELIEKLAYGVIALLSATFLTLPMANPHQIISLFPFLVLLIVLHRRWASRYWLLSLSGLGFIVLMRGPFQFLFPLGAYTSIVSTEQLVQSTIAYASIEGIINSHLNHDFMLIFSLIGTIILFSFLFLKIRIIPYIKRAK